MECPHALSFEGTPLLLDLKHPKDIKVFFINDDPRVENEVHAVFEMILSPLNVKVTYKHTRGVGNTAKFPSGG